MLELKGPNKFFFSGSAATGFCSSYSFSSFVSGMTGNSGAFFSGCFSV